METSGDVNRSDRHFQNLISNRFFVVFTDSIFDDSILFFSYFLFYQMKIKKIRFKNENRESEIIFSSKFKILAGPGKLKKT
jgi:hypothetical protein